MTTTAPAPTFKYAVEHAACNSPCPPSPLGHRNGVMYRWVHDATVRYPGDFLPQGADPSHPKHGTSECGYYGLSFYVTPQTCKDAHAFVKKAFPRLPATTFGTYYAEVHVVPTDGACDAATARGHVNLHEYAGTSWAGRATVVGAL